MQHALNANLHLKPGDTDVQAQCLVIISSISFFRLLIVSLACRRLLHVSHARMRRVQGSEFRVSGLGYSSYLLVYLHYIEPSRMQSV